MKRLIVITIFGFLAVFCASGQNIDNFKARLATADEQYRTSVRVVEHGSAAEVISYYNTLSTLSTVNGYRIRIFFDNSQNARSGAEEIRNRFRATFPDVPTYFAYQNPYFVVTVGNCMTKDEALILFGRVSSSFDKAFLVNQAIPLREFLRLGDGQ